LPVSTPSAEITAEKVPHISAAQFDRLHPGVGRIQVQRLFRA
jgi:hypothetical protein